MLNDRKKNKVKATAAAVAPAKKKILMGRQGAVVFGAMAILFMVGLLLCYNSEMAGNPVIGEMGIDQSAGSMEGKEVRFELPSPPCLPQ